MALTETGPRAGRYRRIEALDRPWVREGAAVVCVLGVMTFVLAPLILHGQLPRATDTTAFYGPFAAFLHDQLAHGELPLWNPTAFSGQPFAADAQSGVVYPPALAAFGLLSPGSGLVALAIFHYALAALGTYAFARLVGAGRIGSIYAAVAYGASGHLVARSLMLGLLAGVAWLPVCLAAAEFAARARPARRPLAILVLGAALAGSILAGSQQLAAVAALSAGLWLWIRAGRRGVLLAVAGVLAAILLSAVALLPRLELLGRSSSAEGVADPSGIGSLVRDDLRAVFGRYGVSRSELTTLYAGAATPALALFGLAVLRRRALPLAALALFAIVWASGLAGWVLGPLPVLKSLATHEPVRAMAVAVLAGAVLAGLALPRLQTRRSLVVLLALSVLLTLALGGADTRKESFLLPLVAILACLPALSGSRAAFGVAALAVLLTVTLDLAWHADHQDREIVWRSASSVFPRPAPSARFLLARQAREGPFRFATAADLQVLHHQLGGAGTAGARALLLDSESVRLGLEDVAGYNPVHLKTYNRYLLASNGGKEVDRHFEYVVRAPTSRLRALGVRYYVSPPGQQPKGLPVVYRDRGTVITRDPDALPLARIVRQGSSPQPANIVRRDPDRVDIVTGGAAGTLVLADAAYPGWHVSVDGHAARARTIDSLFRGVDVGAGVHRVVWTFRPLTLRIGLWISILTLIALSAVSIAWPRVLRRRQQAALGG
jgi:Bacterial membrane protein YfhO